MISLQTFELFKIVEESKFYLLDVIFSELIIMSNNRNNSFSFVRNTS